jgi:Ala-tRNA(Pro) deacylase
MIPSRLKTHLDNAHISYSLVPHVPARSAQYAASLLHVSGKDVAKTVAVRSGKQVLLAVLPASYHVNLHKLGTALGGPAELLTEPQCRQLFPDCEPGAIPPFGELYSLSVYLDKALAEDPEIVVSAGTLSDGIRMHSADFVRLAKPQIYSFAEKGDVTGRESPHGADVEIGGSE